MGMSSYNDFHRKFSCDINIIHIYILEAHFVDEKDGIIIDGWPIGNSYRYPQHKNLSDRLKMANEFIVETDIGMLTLVDNMNNDFNHHFGSWPDRAYIVFENTLMWFSSTVDDGKRYETWTEQIEKIIYGN